MFATWRTQSIILVMVTLLASMSFAFSSFAAAPTNIVTYQGRLLNANSVPVSDASLSMKFFFYTAVTSGTCVWSNSSATCDSNTPASTTARTVTLTSGLFTQNLGDTTDSFAAIADSYFADNSTLFLEVIVGSETLSPRRRLTAAPYALNSQTLDGLSSGDFLRDNGDTATGTYSFGGAVSFDGTTTFNTDVDMTLATTENLTITNATATAEVIDMTVTAAGNDAQEINFTLGNDTDVDTLAALDVIVTSAATSDADILVGLNVANLISADATVIERGVVIGSGWDVNLLFADTTTIIDISDGGSFTFRDGTNTLMTLTDSGTTGSLNVTGTATVGDLSCTDCLDFAELADSLTMDAATAITGAAGRVFSWARTLTDATAENGVSLSVTAVDTTTSTSAQYGLQVTNASSTEGLDALLQLNNADTDDSVATGIEITSAAGTILRGIDFNDTDIVTDIQLQNDETIDNNTDGTIAFGVGGSPELNLTASALLPATDSGLDLGTSLSQFADLYLDGGQLFADNAFDVDVDDNTASAFTVSEGSTNYLALTTTNSAEVLALGATTLTQMTFTTDNNANTDFSFVGGATFNDDVNITAGAGEVFGVTRGLTNATTESGMTLTVTASDTTSGTTSQGGLLIDNAASTEAADGLIILNNTDADDVVGAGVLFSAGGLGTDFTYGIDFDAADIGTADIRFESSGTLDEGSTGTWTFDRSTSGIVTLIATDDDANAAFTLSSGGTGLLSLDPTGAGSIAIGSVDVTSVGFTTDNNANSDFNFVGGVTLNDDVIITAGAGEIFTVTRTFTNGTDEHGMFVQVTASDTGSATTAQFGISVDNAASTEALDASFFAVNNDADDTIGSAFLLGSGAAGTDFTYGIDLDAADIGTADIRFESSGTLNEGSAGTWTFDRSTSGIVSLIATDDDANAAFTISSGGTGILSLDPTGAGSVVVGSIDVTSLSFTTDNNANNDLNIVGGATFNDDVIITAGAGEVFTVTRTLTNATAENAMAINITASDTTSATLVQQGLLIDNTASTEALDAMIALNNSDADDTVGAGLLFASGAAGTDFTYGVDFDAADIGTADIRFESSGTLNEGSAGTWTFDRSSSGTVTLIATDDDADAAFTISSGGTGLLALDPTGAGSIIIGSTDVTSIQFTTDNNAATDLAFTGGSTFNADSLTVANAIFLSADALTTGFGLQVERADGATDFDGATPGGLAYINQANDNTTSDGEALMVRNFGGGTSVGFYLLQNGVNAPPANSTSQTAMVIDVNEAAGDDVGTDEDVFIIRSDADGTADTEFKVQLDGDIAYDGTASSPASDLAEVYPSNEALAPGDVVVLDTSAPGKIKKSSTSYEANLFGAISTKPAVRMGSDIIGYDVALTGRIPLKVSAQNGSITAGDPLTSSSIVGYAMKATEPGMIVGRALASHSVGLGVIDAFVDAQWYAGTVFMTDGVSTLVTDNVIMSSSATATKDARTFDSFGLALRGSAWNGSEAEAVKMMLRNVVESEDDYRLSVRNTSETEVAYITQTGTMKIAGDMVIGGNIYPSDRGVAQTQKYIYYDGSDGAAGDFMRTNAKGWSTGSYDFAEMFPSNESLVSGEVVVFSGSGHEVQRATGQTGEQLAGIVSTRPGFLAGENQVGSYPIALAGRVPTKVSVGNGAIAVGDPLTLSTTIGVAVKATESGQVVGYALEAYDGSETDDLILAFVNIGYWQGEEIAPVVIVQNVASEFSLNTNFSALNMTGNISMNSYDLSGIGKLSGMGDAWELAGDGTLTTSGLLKTVIDSYQNEKVETVAVTSPEVMITLTGTAMLEQDQIEIRFEDVIPEYNDVISAIAPIRVFVTPSGPVSLYVSQKDQNHFVVTRLAGDGDVEFDWMVSAYRKGYEPEEVDEVEKVDEVDEVEKVDEVDEVEEVLEETTTDDPASPASPDETLIDQATDVDGGATAEPPTESP